MENRQLLVQDFLKLKVYLDRSNSKKDLKTELSFLIRTSTSDALELIAFTDPTLKSFAVLCKNQGIRWEIQNNYQFYDLKEYCRNWIQTKIPSIHKYDPNSGIELGQELRTVFSTLFIVR